MYQVIASFRREGAKASTASHILEALRFFDAIVRFKYINLEEVLSSRVRGVAQDLIAKGSAEAEGLTNPSASRGPGAPHGIVFRMGSMRSGTVLVLHPFLLSLVRLTECYLAGPHGRRRRAAAPC